MEKAERDYDLNRAAELRHGTIPGIEKQLKAMEDEFKNSKEFKALLAKYDIQISALSCHGNPVHPNKEIAAQLYLAEGTVRNGISRLLEKLKLKDRTQLAVFAIKNNLV